MRLREVKEHIQGYPDGTWHSWDLKTSMTDAKVGASYQLPMSSRLDMHVKMHDKELSKFRGSKGSKHVPISFAGGGTSCPSEELAAQQRRWTA